MCHSFTSSHGDSCDRISIDIVFSLAFTSPLGLSSAMMKWFLGDDDSIYNVYDNLEMAERTQITWHLQLIMKPSIPKTHHSILSRPLMSTKNC